MISLKTFAIFLVRLALEKEINIKRNSLMIDRDRCLRIRGMFPSTNFLCGYGK